MLEVLDTAGQEEYTALRDQWIRDGEGFVLVYSITSRASFSRIQKFYNQIKMVKESANSGSPSGASSYLASPISAAPAGPPLPVPVMLVGNKSDKAVERAVSAQEGQALAKDLGCEFVEASAKNCINVEKAFYESCACSASSASNSMAAVVASSRTGDPPRWGRCATVTASPSISSRFAPSAGGIATD